MKMLQGSACVIDSVNESHDYRLFLYPTVIPKAALTLVYAIYLRHLS